MDTRSEAEMPQESMAEADPKLKADVDPEKTES